MQRRCEYDSGYQYTDFIPIKLFGAFYVKLANFLILYTDPGAIIS